MSDSKSRLDPNNILKANGGDGNGRVTQNTILRSLPSKEFSSVFPALALQELRTHVVLNEMSEPIEFAYFIESGLASVLNVMQDGKSVEGGLSGSEAYGGT